MASNKESPSFLGYRIVGSSVRSRTPSQARPKSASARRAAKSVRALKDAARARSSK